MYYFINEQKYYNVKDFTTVVFMPFIDIWIPFIFTILFVFTIIISFFLVIIPEIIFLFLKIDKLRGAWFNIKMIFGYRSHSIVWYLLSEIVSSSFFLAYSFSLINGDRIKTELILGLILGMFLSILSYVSILALWVYTIQQTDSIVTVETTLGQK